MCKRFLTTFLFIICTSLYCVAVLTENPSAWLYVRDHGARTSATVNQLISDVGSNRTVRLVFDGGQWAFTNNVTFTTNISVMITEGSPWNLSTGTTTTISSASFIADDYLCFTGSGIVTGSPSFLHKYSDWGTAYIGSGLVEYPSGVLAYNSSNFLVTNNVETTVSYPEVFSNVGGGYNITTSSLTVASSGRYLICMNAQPNNLDVNESAYIVLYIAGSPDYSSLEVKYGYTANDDPTFQLVRIKYLTAGQTVQVKFWHNNIGEAVYLYASRGRFSVIRLGD